MKNVLMQTLRIDGAEEPYDVIATKKVLNRMAYNMPYEKVGILYPSNFASMRLRH